MYSDFRMGGNRKVTIVKNITGDVLEFKEDLAKIVSNNLI